MSIERQESGIASKFSSLATCFALSDGVAPSILKDVTSTDQVDAGAGYKYDTSKIKDDASPASTTLRDIMKDDTAGTLLGKGADGNNHTMKDNGDGTFGVDTSGPPATKPASAGGAVCFLFFIRTSGQTASPGRIFCPPRLP